MSGGLYTQVVFTGGLTVVRVYFFHRDGMLKMKDVYQQNPQLGDPSTLEKQLEENAQKLDHLRHELTKFEVREHIQETMGVRIVRPEVRIVR